MKDPNTWHDPYTASLLILLGLVIALAIGPWLGVVFYVPWLVGVQIWDGHRSGTQLAGWVWAKQLYRWWSSR